MLRGLIAFGVLISRRACLYAEATPTSRNRAIRWVWDDHVASLWNSFLCCGFLCLLDFVSEDSLCFMGGSDVVNRGADLVEFGVVLVGFAHVN